MANAHPPNVFSQTRHRRRHNIEEIATIGQADYQLPERTEEGLFRHAGRRDLRRRILNSLKKGEKPHLGNNDAALECAAALQLFLSHLKKPVMPHHVQQLLLADNPGVTAHMIAKDALGLIRQDVGGRHGELLAGLLDLLRHLTLSGPPSERSELRGSPLPIALLPVFFTLTVNVRYIYSVFLRRLAFDPGRV
ncbi:hypothetical protein K0M31_008301 [Melipona bicolor]|uniref:Rho-GAP domain-containing protein n=1 Tax=Melipona bicolor TaxID=60889 RepID=A0AA40FRI4_9HYME|nr:hypothetical protein K0M31_008301 [Melipona bicolor]